MRYVIEMKEEDDIGWTVRSVRYPTGVTSLRYKQDVVGGLVDVVSVDVPGVDIDVDVWVNDEGLLLGFPVNPAASLLTGQPLVGNAVVCGHDGNGESVSFDVEQVTAVLEYLKQRTIEWGQQNVTPAG